jgi:hypothetical protein
VTKLFEENEQRLTPEECWRRLEEIDQIVDNNTQLDNRDWGRLRARRRWWVLQLQYAQERDAFHQTKQAKEARYEQCCRCSRS